MQELIKDYRSIYHWSIVADGNFKLENMKLKCPQDDVSLSDGRGFMVKDKPYQAHIMASVEAKQVTLQVEHYSGYSLITFLRIQDVTIIGQLLRWMVIVDENKITY